MMSYNTYEKINLTYLAMIVISHDILAVTTVIMQIFNAVVHQYFTVSL